MKIINGSFVNMLDELENFEQLSSSLNHGWTEKYEEKRREKRAWEGERERKKKARRNPKIVLGKVFLARNQQETREKRKNKGT